MLPPVYTTHPIETVSVAQIVYHEAKDWIVGQSEQTPSRPDLWTLTLLGTGAAHRSGAYITKARGERVTVRVR